LEKYTADFFFGDRIKIYQPETGYRFSMDPVILAAHVAPRSGDKIIDIGCGCGIMPVIIGFRHRAAEVFGVEIQSQLALLAQKNIHENKLTKRLKILTQDICTTSISDIRGYADIIISNPPYKKKNSGRINPDPQKAIARHEIKLNLDTLLSNANRLLKKRGLFVLILPAERLSDLITAMQTFNFQLDWLRFIHTRKNKAAKLVLASGIKNGRGSCTVLPPLYIYNTAGQQTKEYTRMFNP